MDRWLVGTLAASAVGFVLLGTWSEAATLPTLGLDELDGHEGERLCVQARLAQLRNPNPSSTRLVLTDGQQALLAWARFSWQATPGDLVQACGVVARGPQALELQPARPRDLTILEAWDHQARPLAGLAVHPWQDLGQRLTVWGRIERASGTSWLVDPAGAGRLPLVAADPPSAAWARIDGWVEYDADAARFGLRVENVDVAPEAPAWTS